MKKFFCIRTIIFVFVFVFVFVMLWKLPSFGLWYGANVKDKVSPNAINISRVELLKILISLIAPILTFLVFMNTLSIQKKNQEESEKLNNSDSANREFYSLLDLFKKEQNKSETIKAISFLYKNAINDKNGKSFINDYNIDIGNGLNFSFNLFESTEFFPITIQRHEYKKYKDKDLTKEQKVELVISRQFDDVYNKMSSYFKIFHRILKSLNKRFDEKKLDESDYKNYIGILRTQLSSEELVVILINSLYVKRGLGLGIELIGTNLFGDEKDFKINQHFVIPKPEIIQNDLSIFINDNEGKNIKKRKAYEENLKSIDNIAKFENIRNFKSFIKPELLVNFIEK